MSLLMMPTASYTLLLVLRALVTVADEQVQVGIMQAPTSDAPHLIDRLIMQAADVLNI
jgi:hypothetical protein